MEIIKHPEFGEVRTVIRKGETWFSAQDVCAVLKHSNHSKAVRDMCDDDEKGVTKSYTPGGTQEISIISESGLYSLILRSRVPEAKRFRKWVTSEVLPSIRRHGFYFHPDFLGTKEMKLLQRQSADSLKRYLPEEDIRKIAKKYGRDRYFVLSVIDGRTTHNAIMQDLQSRALDNKSRELQAYHPMRLREVIEKLNR